MKGCRRPQQAQGTLAGVGAFYACRGGAHHRDGAGADGAGGARAGAVTDLEECMKDCGRPQ